MFFKKKTDKDREREIREEERSRFSVRLQIELKKQHEEKILLIKYYDKKIQDERKQIIKEKDDEIKILNNKIEDQYRFFQKFRRDLESMEIIATEMSSLGYAIENMTTGFTRKFHGFKTRVNLISYSVEKKEKKYRELMAK